MQQTTECISVWLDRKTNLLMIRETIRIGNVVKTTTVPDYQYLKHNK